MEKTSEERRTVPKQTVPYVSSIDIFMAIGSSLDFGRNMSDVDQTVWDLRSINDIKHSER